MNNSGLTAKEAVDSYLSLPQGYRKRFLLEQALGLIVSESDISLASSLFTDSRWQDEWLFPSGRQTLRQLAARRKFVAILLHSSSFGRWVLSEGVAWLCSQQLHQCDHDAVMDLAKLLISIDRSYWSARMWKVTKDSYCLYATLDHVYIEKEISEAEISPSGSFQLLHGSRECQELYFRIGFPYYSRKETSHRNYELYLKDHPWAWDYFLTLDLHPSLLKGVLNTLHDAPPSMRPSGYLPFVDANREVLATMLGDEAFLLETPSDYADIPVEQLDKMDDGTLVRSGAIGYHPSRLGAIICGRIGIVSRYDHGRVCVICHDSGTTEIRNALYEDMERGQVVLLKGTGAIAIHRQERNPALRDVANHLRSMLKTHRHCDDAQMQSPTSSYLSQFLRCFDHLCASSGRERMRFVDIAHLQDLSTRTVTAAMDRMSPQAFAKEVFSRLEEERH